MICPNAALKGVPRGKRPKKCSARLGNRQPSGKSDPSFIQPWREFSDTKFQMSSGWKRSEFAEEALRKPDPAELMPDNNTFFFFSRAKRFVFVAGFAGKPLSFFFFTKGRLRGEGQPGVFPVRKIDLSLTHRKLWSARVPVVPPRPFHFAR